MTSYSIDHGELSDKLGMTTEELLNDDGTILEARLRERFHPPAGFRMPYNLADFEEVGIDDVAEHGGFWDGPVIEGEQWKVTTSWTAAHGVTFHLEGDGDNAIPVSEAPKVAAALAEVAAIAASAARA